MAKDNRTINSSIRLKGGVFGAGQEDEFEAAATPAEIARLTERGVITGFAKAKAAAPAEPDADKSGKSKEK